jgi:class 3 adenylate cyclase
MAAFEDLSRAIACAVALQRAIEARERGAFGAAGFRVRMGLHRGTAVVDERDLFGNVVNTAARVVALAEGEEILLSEEVRERAGD